MDYRNAKQINGIYYYPNSSFNTVTIRLNFMAGCDNDEAPIYDLLCYFLTKSNQEYKSDDEIHQRKQELYSLHFDFCNLFYGNQKVFLLNVNMISPNLVQEDYSKDAFKFIQSILKKPDFTNQAMLDFVKKDLISNIRLKLAHPETYVRCMYNQMVIPDERRKYDDSADMDYITSMIESVTLEDLEREYHYLLSHFHSGFVFGNTSVDQFNSFVDSISLIPKPQDIVYHRNIVTTEGDIEIEKESEQSYIYVTYDMDELTSSQFYVLYYIFNSSLGLCYQTLREKYGLVYSSHANIMKLDNKLKIYGEIDKNKKEKFLQALDEIIADLNNPELLKQFVARAKDEFFANEYTYDEDCDNNVISIDNYLLNISNGLDRNQIIEGIQNLTSEELLPKMKSIRKKNVFMVRGKDDESF